MLSFHRIFIILFTLSCLLLNACSTNLINLRNAERYYYSGIDAGFSGDWHTSRALLARAITNADLGGAELRTLGLLWYEYGRASGVICDWPEAEQALERSFAYDTQSQGPAYMSLYELAYLYSTREMYEKALPYYARALVQFERLQMDTQDPIGIADFLDEYAFALEKTGQLDQVDALRQRALAIRQVFPKGKSHTDKTPYGTACSE